LTIGFLHKTVTSVLGYVQTKSVFILPSFKQRHEQYLDKIKFLFEVQHYEECLTRWDGSMNCELDCGYKLSTCCRPQENHGKFDPVDRSQEIPVQNWLVDCRLVSKHTNSNDSPY